jgi:signal transduction histidine kinase
MFDPFYTTRTREGGTGLGATVAYAIVEQHGGRIEVQSWLGIGTRVEIWLPLTPVQEG